MAEPVQLKVAASSNPASVGGAIAKNLHEKKTVELIAVGAGAVNQMVKSVAIASGFIAPTGRSISVRVGFIDTTIDDSQKTAILFKIIEG